MESTVDAALVGLKDELDKLDKVIERKHSESESLKPTFIKFNDLRSEVKTFKKKRRELHSHLMFFVNTIKGKGGTLPASLNGPLFQQEDHAS